MADTVLTKKITDLPEGTEINDADLIMTGVNGTASLRKNKWSKFVEKLRSILFVDSCASTETGYGLTAKQGKLLQDQVNELNTNMGDLIKVVTQTGPHTFALEAHTAIEASSHVTLPTLEGYTRLIYFLKPNGNPAVIAAGPNSNWVMNTSTQKANAVRLDSIGIFIKNV